MAAPQACLRTESSTTIQTGRSVRCRNSWSPSMGRQTQSYRSCCGAGVSTLGLHARNRLPQLSQRKNRNPISCSSGDALLRESLVSGKPQRPHGGGRTGRTAFRVYRPRGVTARSAVPAPSSRRQNSNAAQRGEAGRPSSNGRRSCEAAALALCRASLKRRARRGRPTRNTGARLRAPRITLSTRAAMLSGMRGPAPDAPSLGRAGRLLCIICLVSHAPRD